MRTPILLLTATALSAPTASAQSITVRDKLVALPPVSICQDGATHQTIVTKHRLRPGKFDLTKFVGKPVEVTGTPGAVTCKFIIVSAIKVITADQTSVPSKSTTTVKVEFYGTASSVYALYLGGLATTPFNLPGINGPIHLNPSLFFFLGVYNPTGSTKPYATFTAPATPAVLGVNFYDQAVSVTAANAEMTNVDVFKF